MMAAGHEVEPLWAFYRQHYTPQVQAVLAQ